MHTYIIDLHWVRACVRVFPFIEKWVLFLVEKVENCCNKEGPRIPSLVCYKQTDFFLRNFYIV